MLKYQAGAFPGSPIQPGCMCGFAMYDLPNVEVIGYDVVSNRPKVAAYRAPGAPIASFAVECAMDDLARKLGMDPIELREKNARAERHQDALRADASEHRLPRHAGGGEEQRALEVAAEAGPGARHRLRLLVQHRRRVLGGGARGRGRHGGGGVGQPGYRRLARLDRHDGGRDAADSGREGAHDRRPTPPRSASPTSPAGRA